MLWIVAIYSNGLVTGCASRAGSLRNLLGHLRDGRLRNRRDRSVLGLERGRRGGCLAGLGALLVVLAHALDLGLEDPQRAPERAGHVGQLLPTEEQHGDDDRQDEQVPGAEQLHEKASS